MKPSSCFFRFLFFTFLLLVHTSSPLYAQCIADAGTNTTICEGETISLGGNSTGLIFTWSPQEGLNDSTLANPNANPTTTTIYTLTVTDTVAGCTATDQVTITVEPSPTVPSVYNFYFGIIQQGIFKDCSGVGTFTVSLMPNAGSSMTVTAGVDSFTVDWGDGLVQTGLLTVPSSHAYTQAGVYDLVITAHGSNGCTRSNQYIVANQTNPAVGINSLGGTQRCAPADLEFILSSYTTNSPGTSYIWDFGNGNTVFWDYDHPLMNSDTVSHVFNMTSCGQPNDEFVVMVSAGNFCDTTTAAVNNVKIFEAPQADFEAMPTVGCDSTLFCFDNTTILGSNIVCTDFTEFEWNFGDGSGPVFTNSFVNGGDVCHTFPGPGNYTVTLKALNNVIQCDTSMISKTVVVNSEPIADIQATDSVGCVPLSVTFDGSASTGGSLSFHWEVLPLTGWNYVSPFHADSVITRINFTVPNAYQIYLITTNNCGIDTAVYTVVVGGGVSLNIDPIPDGCDLFVYTPTVMIDSAFGSLDSILWSFSGVTPGNSTQLFPPPITYSTPGPYTVSVSTITSCGTASDATSFTIFDSPEIGLGLDTVCQGSPTSFSDLSLPGDGTIVDWFWDFGDGTIDSVANPSHVFDTCGLHTVFVRITDANGCTDSMTHLVEVYCLPAPAFVSSSSCQDFPTSLTDLSMNGSGNIVQWSWNFGNGSSAAQNPSHTFAACGPSMVSLNVIDDFGCSNSISQNVDVFCPPIADFSALPVCEGTATPFTDNSVAGDAAISQWLWTFGDANAGTSTLQNPAYLYDSCGFYSPSLIVMDQNACADTSTETIEVWCLPTAAFAADTVCQGSGTSFQSSAFAGSAGLETWAWDFGDGNSVSQNTGGSVSHVYDTCGFYTAILTVTDSNSCSHSISQSVFVRCLPSVAFSVVNACLGDSVVFTDLSVSSNGSIQSWLWDFGDNSPPSAQQNPSHIYAIDGFYSVSLTITDDAGCQFTDSLSVQVYPLPSVAVMDSVQICNQSLLDTLSSYILSASDPGIWSGPAAIASQWTTLADSMLGVYDPTGLMLNNSYVFTHTVSNTFGCEAADSIQITVINAQAINPGLDTSLCFDDPTYDLSQLASPAGGTWSMTGVGISGNFFNPSAAGAGVHPIYYTIGSGTCIVVDSILITVNPPLIADAGPDSLFCFGDSIQIGGAPTAMGGSSPYLYLWQGNGLSSPTIPNPIVSGINGTETYFLTITDVQGCVAMDTVVVVENPVLTVDAGERDTVCFGEMATLNGLGQGGSGGPAYDYQWSPAALVSTPTNGNTQTLALTSSQLFILTITDSAGCMAVDSVFIFVNPAMSLSITGDPFVCYEDCANLTAVGSGGSSGYSYQWSPTTGLSDPASAMPQACGLTATQAYSLTLTDTIGCTAVETFTVTVNPELIATAQIVGNACFADTIQLEGIGMGGASGYSYDWSPAAGLSATNISMPQVYGLTTTQTYTLVITDAAGCIDSSQVTVVLNAEITVEIGADTLLCYGDTLPLNPTVNGGIPGYSYQWTPATFLSSAVSPAPDIQNITQSTSYILIVSDAAGCDALDTINVTVNPQLFAEAGSNGLFCFEDSTQIGGMPTASGGTSPYLYQWQGNGLSSTIIPNPIVSGINGAEIYSLVITDAQACVEADTVEVFGNPSLSVDAGERDTVCFGDMTTLNGLGMGGSAGLAYNYQWSPSALLVNPTNATTQTLALTSSQLFTLTITDSAGCVAVDSIFIFVNPAMSLSITGDSFVCYEACANLAAVAGGGSLGYSYQWNPTTGLNDPTSATPQACGLTATQTYGLTVTDSIGCTISENFTIQVNPEIVVSAFIVGNACFADTVQLGTNVSGGSPNYSYAWSPFLPSIPNPQVIGLTSTQIFSLMITDSQGCSDSAQVGIVLNDEIVLDVGPDTLLCYGDTLALSPTITGGAIPYSNYQWTSGLFLSTDTILNPIVQGITQTMTYTLTVLDSIGCAVEDSLTISVNPQIVADAGPDRILCFGETDTIGTTANPGGTTPLNYQWIPATGLSGINTPQVLVSQLAASETYTLLITDAVGCTDSSSTFVYANPALFVDAGLGDSICYEESTQLNSLVNGGTMPYVYDWSPLLAPVSNPSIIGLTQTTTYLLNLVDSVGCEGSDSVLITVNPALIASAVSDSICDGEQTSLNGGASGGTGPYLYQWSPSTFLSPSTTIADPMVVNLDTTTIYSLVLTDSVGCADTTAATITFVPLPEPDFQINFPCISGQNGLACVNEAITLTDASVSPPGGTSIVNWEWDLDNDGIIDTTGNTVVISFSATGTYTIELIVTSLAGCKDSVTQTLTVVETPTAHFVVQPDTACAPVTIAITDSSIGYIQTYDWQIYGLDATGTAVPFYTSSSATPSNLPVLPQGTAGDTTYYISLMVGNCCGIDTFLDSVTVLPLPIVGFETTQDTGCSPLPIEFMLQGFVTVESTDSVVFDWGDGSPLQTVFQNPPSFPLMWSPITHVFTGNVFTDTTFEVTLYGYTSCGVDSFSSTITVLPNGVQAFFNTTNFDDCEDLTVQVVNAAAGDSLVISWCFDYDSVNQTCLQAAVPGTTDTLTYTYTDPGDYLIAQFVNNGCSYDTAFFAVTVRPRPSVDFQASALCLGDSTQFLNLSSIDSTVNAQGAGISGYIWDFGGLDTNLIENPSYVFPAAGTYDVSLIAISDRDCADTMVQTVSIWNLPEAELMVDTACFGLPNLLTDSSSSIDGLLTNWTIVWGDGTDTSLTAPFVNPQSHVYPSSGTFAVELSVIDSNGCLDTTLTMAEVLNLPQASFVSDTVCEGSNTLLTDQSQVSTNAYPLTTWTWDFGDNSPIVQNNTSTPFLHLYPTAGLYLAELIVTDAWGCEDSISEFVTVDTLPIAAFSATTVCVGLATQFTDLSVSTSHTIGSWTWDFGDSNQSTLQNPTHTYSASGLYTVSLTVEDGENCSHTFVNTIEVLALPVAIFAPADTAGCQSFDLLFSDLSIGFSGAISVWEWEFGDGNISNAQNPSHLYTDVGTYTVSLFVSDVNGCQSDTTGMVEVFSLPEADFVMDDSLGCGPKTIQFTDQSIGDYVLVSWEWNFGDGENSPLPNPSHTYQEDGIYQVSLTVTDENGCQGSYTYPTEIRLSRPVADFEAIPTAICPGSSLQLLDISVPDTTLISWTWDLGNGMTSTEQFPTVIYHQPGLYSISLVVENVLGCTAELIRENAVEVYRPPLAQVALLDEAACRPYQLRVSESSTAGSSPVVAWEWNFGDGSTGTGQIPDYLYDTKGEFPLTMTITDTNGCKDTAMMPVLVTAPVAHFEFQDSLPCLPGSITFFDRSEVEGNAGWRWDFGDGNGQVDISNPTHRYQENGTYLVKMVIQDPTGCLDSTTQEVNTYEFPSDFAEQVVRATVDTSDNKRIFVEWDSVQHPRAHVLVIEKSSDWGQTFQPIYAQPVGSNPLRRYGDTDVSVNRRPYVYRIATQDTCGFQSPYSNIGQTIRLEATRTGLGVRLDWTRYKDWQLGVLQYELFVGYRQGSGIRYQSLKTFVADTSYLHEDPVSIQDSATGNIHYFVKAYELGDRDTVSFSNEAIMTGEPRLFVPTAFSPNGDGRNDFFDVNEKRIPWADPDSYLIQIFNRWGQKIFESNDVTASWDGTWNDKGVTQGVYVFKVSVRAFNGNEISKAGTVTLIR